MRSAAVGLVSLVLGAAVGAGCGDSQRIGELADRATTGSSMTGTQARSLLPDEPVEPAESGNIDSSATRLLADELVGPTYSTAVALDAAQYVELWESVGLTGERPPVDFGTSIVVHFGAVYSGSCPELRFNGVVIDADAGVVHADINRDDEGACTDDANPRAFVVAVERDVLPASPFRAQLSSEIVCQGCDGSERTLVDLDAGTTDDRLSVLVRPVYRPVDDPFPPGVIADAALLADVLGLIEIFGDTIDHASAAIDAAGQLDISTYRDSLVAAQAAIDGSQAAFDDVVGRLEVDERAGVVAVAEAAVLVRQAEVAWVAELAHIEASLQLRIDEPRTANDAWNAAVLAANAATGEADTRMSDFLLTVELLFDTT